MPIKMPDLHQDPQACARDVISQLDKRVVMGLPLGLGKPAAFANAIYQLARQDPSIRLDIFTALTLQPPAAGKGLAARFLGPLAERLFDGVPSLDYERDRRRGELPANIKITEFYFAPGSQLGVPAAQTEYCSMNYTHVTRELLDRGVNLLATLVAVDDSGATPRYSLSCNPDLTLDLAGERDQGAPIVVLGQVNRELPFMPNDAEVEGSFFDHLLQDEALEHPLFPALNRPVSLGDYATGLHVASLVRDGGTLQIGIGSLGDAVVNALVQREHHTEAFGKLLDGLLDDARMALRPRLEPEKRPFRQGLYGASEMLVHGFAGLRDAQILKRRVFEDVAVQGAVNANLGDCRVSAALLQSLLDAGAVASPLSDEHLEFLQQIGVLDAAARQNGGRVMMPDGRTLPLTLDEPAELEAWAKACAGRELSGGYWLEAGFFLGPNGLYRWLRGLSPAERAGINMTTVSKVNQLFGGETLRRLQRRRARFINEAMMVTLTGAVVSDALDSAQIVSGVGGQYNFVAMAHELQGARSIIVLPSTRRSGGVTRSNIVWNYAHTTIPRHLRDIVVTEYGAADLRGLSDRDVIAALLNISDSRFQNALLQQAVAAGKIEPDYEIPGAYRRNSPQRIEQLLLTTGDADWFPHFPWGSDMSDTEAALALALAYLKQNVSGWQSMLSLWRSLPRGTAQRFAAELERMGLHKPGGFAGRLERRLLLTALHRTAEHQRPLKPLGPKYGDC